MIPAGFNPHAYEPRTEDIKRIASLDAIVLNGVGHDDFAGRMIKASEKPDLQVIEANAQVPLLAAVGAGRGTSGKVVNPHTFLSVTASISQVNTIARALGQLDPANAAAYTANARAYAQKLRKLRADVGPDGKTPGADSASPPSTAPTTTCCASSAWRWRCGAGARHRAQPAQLKAPSTDPCARRR